MKTNKDSVSSHSVDAPEGYDAVSALLGQASRALQQQRVSSDGWVRIRESIPDEAPAGRRPSPLRWLLLCGGLAAAAAVAVAIVPERPVLTTAQPVTAQSAPSPAVTAHPTVAADAGVVVGQMLVAEHAAKEIVAFSRHAMTLEEGARVRVERWQGDHIELALEAGAIDCNVTPVDSGSVAGQFVVVAGETRVSVVGTRFRVARDAQGLVSVSVDRGEVVVARGGVAKTLLAGDRWVETRRDAPTAAPANTVAAAVAEAPEDAAAAKRVKARRNRVSAPQAAHNQSAPSKKSGEPPASDIEEPQVVGAQGGADVDVDVDVDVDASAQPKPIHTTTVDISVTATQKPVEPVPGGRALLSGAVGLIRAGRCGAAKSTLRKIYQRLDAKTPPDLFYLMGYCLHQQGKLASAKAFFARYRRLSSNGRFQMPSEGAQVPVPSVGQLSP